MSRLQIDTDQHVARVLSEHVDRQFDRLKRQIDILTGQVEGLRRSQATYLGDNVACTTLRNGRRPEEEDVCSMCGEFCVFRIAAQARDRHGPGTG